MQTEYGWMHPLRIALALLALTPELAGAAWPHNLSNGGVAVSTAAQEQQSPAIVADGSGGAIVVWQDRRNLNFDIFAQRLNARGELQWPANGVSLCTQPGDQRFPVVISDGQGGAIVTWEDGRGANTDIYTQRIDAGGLPLWTTNGVALCTFTGNQTSPRIETDGSGGAIVTWVDARSGTGDIFAQRINSGGVPQWSSDGVGLCVATGNQAHVSITSDGAGGAIVTWDDSRSGNADIYAQRVNAAGTPQWTPTNGVPICTAALNQLSPTIAPDGLEGAIIAWSDGRNTVCPVNDDIYVQRISHVGTTQWAFNGVSVPPFDGSTFCVSGSAYNERYPKVVANGTGGALVAFEHSIGSPPPWGVQIRSVTAGGVVGGGTSVGGNSPVDFDALYSITSDGTGGAVIACRETPTLGGNDVRVTRVDRNGSSLYSVLASQAPNSQDAPTVASDGKGAAISVWQDTRRSGIDSDIYAQRIERFSLLGDPEPRSAGVKDVPNDQGGRVRLSWYASYLDKEVNPILAAYDVYRSAPISLVAEAMRNGAVQHRSFAGVPEAGRRRFVVGPASSQIYAWEYMTTVNPVHFLDAYAYIAPTTGDSISGSNALSAFMVVGRNSDGSQYWLSEPDSGYSVDNLAPLAPAPFTGAYAAGSTHLHWGVNLEPDIAGYRLYRGNSPTFVPGPANLVVAQPDTGYADAGGAGSYYKLAAVDVHGNLSAFALLTPTQTMDVGGELPRDVEFRIASSNPGGRGASLRYALPQAGRVEISVFDLQGREVRVLLQEPVEAGEHMVRWDGRDAAGNSVSGGVYLMLFRGIGHEFVRRFVLLQ
jgi:hypothetical protein